MRAESQATGPSTAMRESPQAQLLVPLDELDENSTSPDKSSSPVFLSSYHVSEISVSSVATTSIAVHGRLAKHASLWEKDRLFFIYSECY